MPHPVGKEEKPMKKTMVIGSVEQNKELLAKLDPQDFSNEEYNGFSVFQHTDGRPVVLLVSKSQDPVVWRIVDGLNDYFFRSFCEAEAFCKEHKLRFVK